MVRVELGPEKGERVERREQREINVFRILFDRVAFSYEGSSMIVCNLCLYPPTSKRKRQGKEGDEK